MSKPRVVEYSEGAVIFKQGDAGDVMYVLQRGSVQIQRRVRDRDYVLTVLYPGSFFGELAIFNKRPRSATVVALEPVQALLVTGDTLIGLLQDDGELAMRIMQALSKRVDRLTAQLESVLQGREHYQLFESLSRLVDQKRDVVAIKRDEPSKPHRISVKPSELARPGTLSEVKTAEILEKLAESGILESSANDTGSYTISEADTLMDMLQAYIEHED